jgi:hypothetical protein
MYSANLFRGFLILRSLLHILRNGVFDDSVLFLCPPISQLGKILVPEVLLKALCVALVGREEDKQIPDPTSLESTREMINSLIREISAEDASDGFDRDI